MKNKPSPIGKELLCMNAEKVYDWVILQGNVSTSANASELGGLTIDPCDPSVSKLTTETFLTDEDGNRLSPNDIIEITESQERSDRPFIIDGTEVMLQNVSFQKTLYVVVEFSGLKYTTPFVEQTLPIPITIPESLFMCAPNGTDLVVRITDVDCTVSVNCTDKSLTSLDITLNVCQSVQSVTEVTVELFTKFCEPRDVLTEQCPSPIIPPQCPVIFPG